MQQSVSPQGASRRARLLALWLPPLLLLLVAALSFGWRYWEPRYLFWDENYHVTSAHKQLAGVMYMEAHPPLGKMLIAAGEAALGVNRGLDTTPLLHTDHVAQAQLPPGFSFAGLRLASVLSLVLATPLLYLLLASATGSRAVAFVLALAFALDNAIVVHGRAAMLEGPQLLFVLLALWLFARAVRPQLRPGLQHYFGLGAVIGLAMAVKLNAAVLLLLPPALLAVDQYRRWSERSVLARVQRCASTGLVCSLGLLMSFGGAFWLHIATTPNLIEGRTYKASPDYIQALRAGHSASPRTFAIGLRDHMRHILEYSEGVPRFDACKPGENGSPALHWPLGGKTINYRWERNEVDGLAKVSYTYLVTNPVVWLGALVGLVLSWGLLIAHALVGLPGVDRRLLGWIALACALHLGYMVSILQVERVMYLYHYLLPLCFALLNLGLLFSLLFREGLSRGDWHPRLNLAGYAALVLAGFLYFAPFTYGWPLDEAQVERRAWLSVWKLEPVR